MKFTIFTPTYNRRSSLERVYKSLCDQSLKDFEWLIVDDGSNDGTEDLVSLWVQEKKLTINYYYQTNMGKPSALNKGIQLARGKLFACLDSDDEIVPHALNRLWMAWEAVEDKSFVKTITCMCKSESGEILRNPKIEDLSIFSPIDMFFFQPGERWGCHELSSLKKFSFPIFSGEKFIPESVVWLQLAEIYHAIWVNEALRIYHNSKESLSSISNSLKYSNPNGYLIHYATLLKVSPTLRLKTISLLKLIFHILVRLILRSKL